MIFKLLVVLKLLRMLVGFVSIITLFTESGRDICGYPLLSAFLIMINKHPSYFDVFLVVSAVLNGYKSLFQLLF